MKDTIKPRNTEGNISDIDTQETFVPNTETATEESDEDNIGTVLDSDKESENTRNIETTVTPTSAALSVPSVSVNFTADQGLQTQTQSSSRTSTSRHYKKKRTEASDESVERQLLQIESKKLEILNQPEDDDLMFFKSLLPYFKQMNPIQKLRIRSKFQNIIIEEMTNPLFNVLPSNTDPSAASSLITSNSQNHLVASSRNSVYPHTNPSPVTSLNTSYSYDTSSVVSPTSLQSPDSDSNPLHSLQYIQNNDTPLSKDHMHY